MSQEYRCPTCGSPFHPPASFCKRCGAPLPTGRPQRESPRTSEARPRRLPGRRAGAAALVTFALAAGGWAWSAGYLDGLIPWGLTSEGTAEPNLSVAAVHSVLEDPAIRTDPEMSPWLGVTVEDEPGAVYHYDGSSWSAVTRGGDWWGPPGATARVFESSGRVIVSQVDPEESEWVRRVLDDTPGLTRDGENYRINDYVLYRDGFIQAASDNGVVVTSLGSDSISMTRPAPLSYVWVEPADDHVWIIDETAAVLMVEVGQDLTTAGRLLPDVIHGAVWEPAPNTEALSGTVSRIFDDIDGAIEEAGRREIPFKIFIPGEAPAIRVDKIPTEKGRPASVEVRRYEPPKEECTWWKCVIDAVGGRATSAGSGLASGLDRGWNGVVNGTGEALERADLETLDCLLGTTVVCTLQTAASVGRGTLDVVEALWEVRGNIFIEKNCDGGSPGPGRGPDGDAGDHTFPVETNGYSMQGVRTPVTTDWPAQLELARRWMPLIELSADERCGEILRVFAKVHAYGPDGEQANSLDRADRVEIVYTLFFKEDGGRFQILGTDHPGDNEGFVIGLVHTNERAGLCASGFEFVAGRTVGHKDSDNLIVKYLKVTEREIDDFDAGDVGTGCPERADPAYRLLVAEAKHATYYHREVCERALLPNLPALVGGFVGGGLPGTLTAEALMALAPDSVADNLRNGLEECESGRPLIDLSSRLELFAEELRSIHGEALGFYDTYMSEDGLKTFEEGARGRWCYGPIASSLPRDPDCAYDYHIPEFFDYVAANRGTTVPALVNLTEEQARAAVEVIGLRLEVTPTLVDHLNGAGRVLTQDPEAGSQITPGASVAVRVGVYQEVAVPDVTGLSADEARSAIEAAGLIYAHGGTVKLSSDQAALSGFVVDQNPTAMDRVVPGYTVQVFVGAYRAPSTISVPELFGQSPAESREHIEALGFRYVYGGSRAVSDSGLDGLVVDQDPGAGSSLPEGGAVFVYIGEYVPQQVSVPDLGGLTETDARARVQGAGLIFEVAGTTPTSDSMVGRVVDQDPISGTLAEGSTIRVWIGEADASGEETSLSFPEQDTSPWVSVSITGGHGSVHGIDDVVDLCYGWAQLSGEPPGSWQLWDFQPPESAGVIQDEGSMLSAGSDCISARITGPAGYEEIVAVALEYDHGSNSWQVKGTANVWIYVTE